MTGTAIIRGEMSVDLNDHSTLETRTPLPAEILANRYRLLSRVADALAHEVKNPIHASMINLELLRCKSTEPDLVRERAGLLEFDITRVHDLIDAFFRFLRPHPDPDRWTDLDAALGQIVPLIEAYCHVARIEFAYHTVGCALCAIPKPDLQQIVLELVLDTVDALGRGGRVEISVTEAGPLFRLGIQGVGKVEAGATRTGGGVEGAHARYADLSPRLAVPRFLARQAGGYILTGATDGRAGNGYQLLLSRAAPGA